MRAPSPLLCGPRPASQRLWPFGPELKNQEKMAGVLIPPGYSFTFDKFPFATSRQRLPFVRLAEVNVRGTHHCSRLCSVNLNGCCCSIVLPALAIISPAFRPKRERGSASVVSRKTAR
jgi:hypothetical protein